jgi:hypothetical protein
VTLRTLCAGQISVACVYSGHLLKVGHDLHQPVRVRNRKRTQQNRVHDAKNRRVRAHAQSQGKHRYDGETRTLPSTRSPYRTSCNNVVINPPDCLTWANPVTFEAPDEHRVENSSCSSSLRIVNHREAGPSPDQSCCFNSIASAVFMLAN